MAKIYVNAVAVTAAVRAAMVCAAKIPVIDKTESAMFLQALFLFLLQFSYNHTSNLYCEVE